MSSNISRRSMGAMLLASPLLAGSANVSAQEASPVACTTNGSAAVLLRAFLERAIGEGDARAVDEFFEGSKSELDALYWEFADIQSDARKQDEPFSLDIRMVYGDDTGALAFLRFGAGSWTDKDMFMAVNVAGGKFSAYRWMSR